MKYEAVLFDLDGTLVDSIEDIADSMNKILLNKGFPTHELIAYKSFIGEGIKNLVRKALPEDKRADSSVSLFFDEMMNEYKQHLTEKTRPYDGIAILLDVLTKRQMKLTILSNKADELTKIVVNNLLSDWNFEIVMGAQNHIPRKPNPEGAFIISKKLGIEPNKFIYLGDTGIDMQTANDAGMYSIGVLWGYRSKEDLEPGAKLLIEHPLDVIEWLGTNKG